MHYKRILLIVMIFMTGTLPAQAATPTKSTALEPWTNEVVNLISEGYVGPFVSIDHYACNRKADVSYHDAENGDPLLANQVDPGTDNCPGNLNWKCLPVDDSANDVGQYNSIDVIEGIAYLDPSAFNYAKIGISYHDATAKSLKSWLRNAAVCDT